MPRAGRALRGRQSRGRARELGRILGDVVASWRGRGGRLGRSRARGRRVSSRVVVPRVGGRFSGCGEGRRRRRGRRVARGRRRPRGSRRRVGLLVRRHPARAFLARGGPAHGAPLAAQVPPRIERRPPGTRRPRPAPPRASRPRRASRRAASRGRTLGERRAMAPRRGPSPPRLPRAPPPPRRVALRPARARPPRGCPRRRIHRPIPPQTPQAHPSRRRSRARHAPPRRRRRHRHR